jgi:YHS domain-containing protein
MQTLLWFAFWAGLFFIMMRFGCGAHVMGHGRRGGHGDAAARDGQKVRWVPPESDVDPVCGKTVKPDQAKSAVHDGTVYYFCSNECHDRFETAPQLYVGRKGDREPKQMEHSHG